MCGKKITCFTTVKYTPSEIKVIAGEDQKAPLYVTEIRKDSTLDKALF